MNAFKYIFSLIATATTLNSCHRDELCYLHTDGAMVEVRVDWSNAKLSPNSATLVIHRADGSHYKTIEMDNPRMQLLDLPVGEYHLTVVNESIHDDGPHAATLGYRNIQRWETFEVFSKDDYAVSGAGYNMSGGKTPYRVTPDTLGVDRLLNLRVTQEMVNRYHIHPTPEGEAVHYKADTVINMLPKRPFSVTNMKINFINFKGYAISKQYPPILYGMAESYYPGTDRYSTHPINHAINLIPIVTTRAVGDATSYISSFTVIGLLDGLHPGEAEAPNYRLQIRLLHQGGVVMKEIDLYHEAIMDIIKEPDHAHPEDHINIELDIYLDELVGVGDGMDAALEDWGDQDVPLDAANLIYFNPNGGVGNAYWIRGNIGVTIALPSPVFLPQVGYEFKEWNTKADGNGERYAPANYIVVPRAGVTLYAIWQQKR